MFHFIRKLLKKVKSVVFENENNKNQGFYPISPTCQIPNLNDYYVNYFGENRFGYFIEVGAYDGDMVSNTSGLADLGWNGLYIEPVPSYFKKCKKRHFNNHNVKVLNLAISNKEETLSIIVGGVLSTARKEVRDNFINIGWQNYFQKPETISVLAKPLNLVLKENNTPIGFELLVIDVEGFELNVMQGFEITKWKPKMIIIELHDQNKNYKKFWDENFKVSKMFQDANYQIIYKDLSNTIYISGDIFDLSKDD